MTLTQVDEAITALELALATGSEMVRFGDRTHQYRTPDDIMKALAYFRRKRVQLTTTNPRGFSLASFR